MAFYNQRDARKKTTRDVRCGAFAIAYWIWINYQAKDPMKSNGNKEDENFIQKIYKKIVFDVQDIYDLKNLEMNIEVGYSDPLKMVKFIKEYANPGNNDKCDNTSIVSCLDQQIYGALYKKFGAIHKDFLPNLEPGKYAILMIGGGFPHHYVLAEGVANNSIRITDPETGIREEKSMNLLTYARQNNIMSAIYIKPFF